MPRHVFDQPQILAAARRLVDAAGLSRLTIRALAAELGTGPASVYRHVADRRELLQLLADDVAIELPTINPDLPAAERLLTLWAQLYDFFEDHRWLVDLIAGGEVVSTHAVALAQGSLTALQELGINDPDQMMAYRSLNALLLGSLCSTHPYAHGADRHEPGEDRDTFLWAVRRLINSVAD